MKLFHTILLALSAAFLAIGIHQSINVGFYNSYFIFMFSLICFFGYTYLKGKEKIEKDEEKKAQQKTITGKKKK